MAARTLDDLDRNILLFKRMPRSHFGSFDFVNDIKNSFGGLRNQSGNLVREATDTLD